MLTEVESNLRSMGVLKAGEPLKEVGCIDCHMGVNKDHGQHKTELKMPDAAACGQCHVKQFAERESERDTFTWPQDQWPKGHPVARALLQGQCRERHLGGDGAARSGGGLHLLPHAAEHLQQLPYAP